MKSYFKSQKLPYEFVRIFTFFEVKDLHVNIVIITIIFKARTHKTYNQLTNSPS
jgi:hypothetical protein